MRLGRDDLDDLDDFNGKCVYRWKKVSGRPGLSGQFGPNPGRLNGAHLTLSIMASIALARTGQKVCYSDPREAWCIAHYDRHEDAACRVSSALRPMPSFTDIYVIALDSGR